MSDLVGNPENRFSHDVAHMNPRGGGGEVSSIVPHHFAKQPAKNIRVLKSLGGKVSSIEVSRGHHRSSRLTHITLPSSLQKNIRVLKSQGWGEVSSIEVSRGHHLSSRLTHITLPSSLQNNIRVLKSQGRGRGF